MTQKTLSGDKRRSPLVTPRYMLGTAKRGWALAVLFFIVFILFFTVQAITEVTDFADTIRRSTMPYSQADRVEILGRFIVYLRGTFVIFSAAAAVFAGCYFFSFMHNKTSAGFFHSLPERRSGHFISAIFGAAATYLIGAASNFIFVVFIFAANGFLYAELMLPLLSILLSGIFYFLVFLSFTVLAGTISGNTAIHAIMTAFLLFFLPALYLSGLILVNYGTTYLSVSNLMFDMEAHKWLSPVFRAIYVLSEYAESGATPVWVIVVFDVLLASAFFALAYYAYTKRPIERSGTPIIYGWLSETVKYIIMAPSAVFMSTIFDAFFGYSGYAWTVFGFIAGLLLSYMLCNTVLNRSAKAMFSHARGMLIYSASVSLASILLVSGSFGIFDYAVPVASDLDIYIGGYRISLDDKIEVDLVRSTLKEYVSDLRGGEVNYGNSYDGIYTGYYDDKYSYIIEDFEDYAEGITRNTYMRVQYTTPLGIRLDYTYDHVPNAYKNKIIDAALQCDGFLENLTPKLSELFELRMEVSASSSQILSDIAEEYLLDSKGGIDALRDRLVNMNVDIYASHYREPNGKLAEDFNRIFSPGSADFFQRTSIGTYSTEGIKDYYSGTLYFEDFRAMLLAGRRDFLTGECDIYADAFSGVLDRALTDVERMAELSVDDYFDGIAGTVTEIAVYSKNTGKTKYFKGNEIRDILPRLASVNGTSISPMTRTDDTYVVRVTVKEAIVANYDDYYDEIYIGDDAEFYKLIIDEKPAMYLTWFLEGDVPEFVK